jgi:glutathione peroxidase
MFSKIEVNGPRTHPLFQFLKSEKKGILGSEAIKWNFSKFLVNPAGEVLKRYGSGDKPESIEADVKATVKSG